MRTFYHVVGDALRQGPPEMLELLTPWIISALGALMVGLMLYAWVQAWWG